MESLLAFIQKTKNTVYEVCIIYLISIVTNILGSGDITDFHSVLDEITDISNFSIILMYICMVLLILYTVLFNVLKNISANYEPTEILNEIIRKNSSTIFDSVKIGSNITWGEDRLLLLAPNIILGWKPKDIRIGKYESEKYEFPRKEENSYNKYCETPKIIEATERGNNLPRYMVTEYTPNFNKNDQRLYINLQKTDWSQTSYVWDKQYGEKKGSKSADNDHKREFVTELFNEKAEFLPNSFCLHLILETKNEKVVLAKVNVSKRNDNPGTFAATIGEQIEEYDFLDNCDFYEDFVTRWVKRAITEEFGLTQDTYNRYVDENSIKVLGLNFEGNIYNFSLITTVKLNVDLERFLLRHQGLMQVSEIGVCKAISLDEIPQILLETDWKVSKEYHPSSYLRLFTFYLHKKGYKATAKEFAKYQQKLKKK